MNDAPPISPIVKRFVVEAPAERAFRVFTSSMAAWWPKQHHIGASPLKDCVVEPRVGGRWYEVCEDGSQCQWGKVLVWDPPKRLVLAWQLDTEFQFDSSLVTEVEVVFVAEGPRRTTVEFEHRNLERFGPGAAPTRGAMDEGWREILELFAKSAAA